MKHCTLKKKNKTVGHTNIHDTMKRTTHSGNLQTTESHTQKQSQIIPTLGLNPQDVPTMIGGGARDHQEYLFDAELQHAASIQPDSYHELDTVDFLDISSILNPKHTTNFELYNPNFTGSYLENYTHHPQEVEDGIFWYNGSNAFKRMREKLGNKDYYLAEYLTSDDQKTPIIIFNQGEQLYRINTDVKQMNEYNNKYNEISPSTHRSGYDKKKDSEEGEGGEADSNVGVIMKFGEHMVCSATKLQNDQLWPRIVSRSFRILYYNTKSRMNHSASPRLLETFFRSTLDKIKNEKKENINVMVLANILCSKISEDVKSEIVGNMLLENKEQTNNLEKTCFGKFVMTMGYPLINNKIIINRKPRTVQRIERKEGKITYTYSYKKNKGIKRNFISVKDFKKIKITFNDETNKLIKDLRQAKSNEDIHNAISSGIYINNTVFTQGDTNTNTNLISTMIDYGAKDH